ncbi:MAG: AMP-binding protein [Litorimonas sp.]
MSHPGQWAKEKPDHPAVRLDGAEQSYAEFEARSQALSERLVADGAKTGDVVALWARNHIDYLTAAWGIHRAGLYVLPVAASLTLDEADYILKDSEAVRLIADEERANKTSDIPVWTLGDDLFTAPQNAHASPELEGGDMMYTSGTTGKPKGVRRPLSGSPLGSETRRAGRLSELFGMDGDTVFLSPAPLYHAAPYRFATTVLRLGGTVELMQRFDAKDALQRLERATHSQWVPTMFARLLTLPNAVKCSLSAPKHRKAIHAGAPCPPDVKRAMIDWWGPILHEYYSGTESIGFTHIDSPDWLERPGSVGRPWGCKVHILDAGGKEVPTGETGAVYFSGKRGLSYHNAPEKTDAAHRGDLATMGDIGHVDADGFLYLTDRHAFTILSGGVNVYPREVEDALSNHPDVIQLAVIGVPDADFGQAVQAVVEARAGANESDLAQDLHRLARERLAPFKRPKSIAFAPLPLTESGKVRKRDLIATYTAPDARGYRPQKEAAA